jgi:3-hydroxyisobutyrate dehydrogenase-like beta-hydroxyacid dehydrogenase
MTVGIVSTGYMGAGLGGALRAGGARVVTTLAGRSARTGRLARAAGLDVLDGLDDVLAQAEVILVVTPPGAATGTADQLAAAARRTGRRPLVADLNAIAPATVDHIATTLGDAGLPFVDGSISGPPPSARPGARIYLSGPRADEVAGLPWRDVRPIVLDGPPGRASALKMCTASVYKGFTGIVAQAIRAADHYGVLDEVLDDLADLADPGAVAMAATKADRFVPEMLQIAAAQRAAGLTPALFEALAQVYADIAATDLADGDPETTVRTVGAREVARRLSVRRAPR